MNFLNGTRGILLDIEGTTTPIDFVHDVLFTYARVHVRDFLFANIGSDSIRADTDLLRQQNELDQREGRNPPPLENENEVESIAAYVEWLILLDRKSTGLKSLQGKIWREGYLAGQLKSQVFADVAPALQRWHEQKLTTSIFSSGSVLAQQLLFAHTEAGDLTHFIDNYFDTNTGLKGAAASYRRIADTLGLAPFEILFVSDVVDELDAADLAGMKVLLSIRPGNAPQANLKPYREIHNFLTLK